MQPLTVVVVEGIGREDEVLSWKFLPTMRVRHLKFTDAAVRYRVDRVVEMAVDT